MARKNLNEIKCLGIELKKKNKSIKKITIKRTGTRLDIKIK
jgi:hypothetical protein